MPQWYTKMCSRIDRVGWWINSCYLQTRLSISPPPSQTVTTQRFKSLHEDWLSPGECFSARLKKIIIFWENIRRKISNVTMIVCFLPHKREEDKSWQAGLLAVFRAEWATAPCCHPMSVDGRGVMTEQPLRSNVTKCKRITTRKLTATWATSGNKTEDNKVHWEIK